MRYQSIDSKTERSDEIAAIWPSLEEALLQRQPAEAEAMPVEAPPMPGPAAAMPDVPRAVRMLIVAPYVALMGVFFTLYAGSALALFSIAICAFFVAMFFAVPRLFLTVEADPAPRPTLARFLNRGIDTFTGRTGGRDALIQMLIVPVFLTLGLLTIGIVGKVLIG